MNLAWKALGTQAGVSGLKEKMIIKTYAVFRSGAYKERVAYTLSNRVWAKIYFNLNK